MADLAATRRRWWPPGSARRSTLVDREGVGGASVLTDCVPSKTLIATADVMSSFESAEELGDHVGSGYQQHSGGVSVGGSCVTGVNLAKVNRRVKNLASAQSEDIAESA